MRTPALLLFYTAALLVACSEPQQPRPLPTGPVTAPALIGSPAQARPVIAEPVPAHPFLAAPGLSTMHADGFNSDVHPGPGPLGRQPQVISRQGSRLPGGQCATTAVSRQGHLVMLCAHLLGFELHLLEPDTLRLLARHKLPTRPSSFQGVIRLDPERIMTDTSGGAYFHLDQADRVVLADSRQRILRIGHRETAPGQWRFEETVLADLSDRVPNHCQSATRWFPRGECDPITAVMPDFDGRLWWVTRQGRIGTLDPDRGSVAQLRLPGEEIQNGFSVAADGVYIISDHALYRLQADADGRAQIDWRLPYDRGSSTKVGSINQGSGTTPTLIGERFVTFTDNADGRINLLVYRRDTAEPQPVCQVPLFADSASATDNSMIAIGRAIVIENNHGYRNALQQKDWAGIAGGVERIDIREDGSGCDRVWQSAEKSPSVVPKLSAASGLVYLYTFELHDGHPAWYLTAVDFETGATAFKVFTGSGPAWDNNWAPITLGPDGTAYIGTFKGVVAVRDGR